ncbi:MAG: helix-turn-helix transcriptional regulator [Candidatus Bipolaricaulota bacterium]
MDSLGQALRRYRLERGMSKRALAGSLGVSIPTVMRWETGEACPNDYNRHKVESLLREIASHEACEGPRCRVVMLSLFDSLV